MLLAYVCKKKTDCKILAYELWQSPSSGPPPSSAVPPLLPPHRLGPPQRALVTPSSHVVCLNLLPWRSQAPYFVFSNPKSFTGLFVTNPRRPIYRPHPG